MKVLIKNKLLLLAALLISFSMLYAGGGNRNGTGGATELTIPVGVRGISLGGSTVANAYGIEALFWNPAGLANGDRNVEATFSYMSYIADIAMNYGAISANVSGVGVFALSIKALSFGDIGVTTVQNPDGTGQTYNPLYLTAGLSYAKKLSDRIAVGLTANFINEKIDQVAASGVAFNIGVMYENLANLDGLNFAVVMKNLGPDMKYDGNGLNTQATVNGFKRSTQFYKIDAAAFELPSTLEFGLSYSPQLSEMNSLMVATTFQNNNFSGDEYKVGVEYGYANTLFLRGGYGLAPELESDQYIFGFTAGMGLNYNLGQSNIKIDYAYRDVEYFDANHIFSVAFGL